MERKSTRDASKSVRILVALLLGAIVGFLYLGFEWIVNNGSNWLWNDVVQSDVYRWRVIPLALVMSIVFSLALKLVKQKRVLKPASGLLDEMDNIKETNLDAIAIILFIGALSLIAGASLGPEASLVAASLGVSAWFSGKLGLLKKPSAFAFGIASIGALLAAFFNSILPIAIPLLILKKKGQLNVFSASIALVTGLAAWSIVRLIKNEAYIEVPVNGTFTLTNLSLAIAMGFLSIFLAIVIKSLIERMSPKMLSFAKHNQWLLAATIFGGVLGVFYLLGGQTIQFSGSEGLKLISENPAQYTFIALVGMIVFKLLATAWSTTSGYRGGLVFPSIYMGVVLSLSLSTAFSLSGSSEAGMVIGSITGMLMGMTNPILGIVLTFALFPIELAALVVGAAIGSIIAMKLIQRVAAKEKQA